MFSYQLWEIFKNSLYTEHLSATASVVLKMLKFTDKLQTKYIGTYERTDRHKFIGSALPGVEKYLFLRYFIDTKATKNK